MNSERNIIKFNERTHNKKFNQYDKDQENNIFNIKEQNRLFQYLQLAVKNITKNNKKINYNALDYGCGTGNLTQHLITLGLNVTAADISDKFLHTIENKFAATGRCRTVKLDANGLKSLKDKSFDILACYSVLHHIPDYLQAVKEMTRIVKPGGIIYIDHEVNESYWNPNEHYLQFLALVRPYHKKSKKWYRWFQIAHYTNEFILRIRKTDIFNNTAITNPLNPRYQAYGDIHVWPDDHIEWSKIEQLLKSTKNSILIKDDYLLYKAHYPKHLYDQFKNKCSDHRVLIAKKL